MWLMLKIIYKVCKNSIFAKYVKYDFEMSARDLSLAFFLTKSVQVQSRKWEALI